MTAPEPTGAHAVDNENDLAGTLGTFWNYSGALWSVALQSPLSLTVWIVGILLTIARDLYRFRAGQALREAEIEYLRAENARLRDRVREQSPGGKTP